MWFEGHWGFQYYMDQLGFHAVNFHDMSGIKCGDIVVAPLNNSNVADLSSPYVQIIATRDLTPSRWLNVMHPLAGAGFYTSLWGPFPFAFASHPHERYVFFEVTAEQLPPRLDMFVAQP